MARAYLLVCVAFVACGDPPVANTSDLGVGDLASSAGDASPDADSMVVDFPSALRRFYVSPSGDDAGDGSVDHPWKTLAHVNAAPLVPGDAVLLARGGSWRESLTVGVDGTAAQPVSFGAYGSGDLPRLYGSDVLDPAQFSLASDGAYQIPAATVNCVTVDHVFLVNAPGAVPTTKDSYEVVNGVLRINSGSDPGTDGRLYSVCTRDDVVYTNAHSHLRFAHLAVDESAKADAGYGMRVMNSTDVQLEECELYRAGKHHLGVINSTSVVASGLYSAYVMPGQGANASAYVSFGDGSGGPTSDQTSEYHTCTFEHPEDLASPGGANAYVFITHGAAIGSVLLDGMISHGANLSVSNGDNPAAQVKVKGGFVDNARLEVDGSGVVVDGLELSGPLASIDLIGSNLIVENVLLTGANPQSAWYQTAIASRGTNNTVRFSTIAMATTSTGYDTCFALVNAATGFNLYANVCVAAQRVLKQWAGSPDAADLAQANYNLYPATPTFEDPDITFAAWQADGLDVGSKTGDPMFIDAANGNYALAPGSPGIDAAPLPAALASAVPTDFAGHPRLQGAAFDIGAFESTP